MPTTVRDERPRAPRRARARALRRVRGRPLLDARRRALRGVRARVRALYGFSRGTQATLSVAQPLLGAMLATGGTPPPGRLGLCAACCLAGYFAVFAANDLIDARLDRERFAYLRAYQCFDIDSAGGRHPLARGRLPMAAAVAWVAGLGALALALAALLSWMCAALLAAAALLEAVYCALARVTPFKFLVSGVMVALGGCLGWFAMTPEADRPLLWLLCLWLAAWEIGGRNIVNDWADVEEDVHLGVRTVPVVYGYRVSGLLTLACLLVTAAAGAALAAAAWPFPGGALLGAAAALLAGLHALLAPGLRLLRAPDPCNAMALFNRASLYPVTTLAIAACGQAAAHWP
ncbi:UbiA family prenyltransferase [Streptomyces sp. DSM 44917]|uniref:UbiA family prenyltransferase n=1 Tax=Streptomyces boetiae TaxID=3075541 RepID=A0ABU2LDP9_9ACTN|nr:UbiA family prenyltransferase [Streptomyces sp. DSM 44917]MDT0309308.1 UbiA family prenyltransferase [Streptomyces sp. DSM 44917]